MLSGGSQFREAREAKGLTLADVERATHIPTKYLSAIENDNDNALPDFTYAIGFMRSYGRFLNISADEIVNSYKELYEEKDKVEENAESIINYDSKKAIKKANHTPLKKWQFFLIIVLVLAVITFGVIYALGLISNNETEPQTPVEPSQNEPQTPVEPPVVPNIDQPDDTDTNTPAAPVIVPLEIKISAAEGKCWIGATAYDGTYTNVTLQKGEELTLTDDKYYKIVFGNSGVVKVIVNSITQEPFGKNGEVVTKEFFAEEYSQ